MKDVYLVLSNKIMDLGIVAMGGTVFGALSGALISDSKENIKWEWAVLGVGVWAVTWVAALCLVWWRAKNV